MMVSKQAMGRRAFPGKGAGRAGTDAQVTRPGEEPDVVE